MKKNINIALLCLLIICNQSLASKSAQPRQSICNDFSLLAYKLMSLLERSDYVFLAYTDSTWFLKKKILLQENMQDLDKYYHRYGIDVNDTSITIYRTPLHEAVIQGNFDSIRMLCAAGSDTNKKIKCEPDIKKEEIAQESRGLSYSCISYDVEPKRLSKEIATICKENYVGLCATEIAKKILKHPNKFDTLTYHQRKAIYNFLKKQQGNLDKASIQ